LPIVVSDNGGNAQLVNASGAGEVFPVGDVEVASGFLSTYLMSEELRSAASENALTYVRDHHDIATISADFLRLSDQVVSTIF